MQIFNVIHDRINFQHTNSANRLPVARNRASYRVVSKVPKSTVLTPDIQQAVGGIDADDECPVYAAVRQERPQRQRRKPQGSALRVARDHGTCLASIQALVIRSADRQRERELPGTRRAPPFASCTVIRKAVRFLLQLNDDTSIIVVVKPATGVVRDASGGRIVTLVGATVAVCTRLPAARRASPDIHCYPVGRRGATSGRVAVALRPG